MKGGMMNVKMKHLDYALLGDEITICAGCGSELLRGQNRYGSVAVTPAGRYAVGGMIGLCSECGYSKWGNRETQKATIKKWRETAPQCIQLLRGKPVQLVVRGKCNDLDLAKAILTTFEKVPDQSRTKILDYVLSHEECTVTRKGMRFEALSRWPGIHLAAGMNLDRGHAIRLRASYVRDCMRRDDMADLILTIAHELGHTEQEAEGKSFENDDESERDVEARLLSWGFHSGQTTESRESLLAQFDSIIRLAKNAKKDVANCNPPSSNFRNAALSQADRAMNDIIRAVDRWKGIGQAL